MKCSIPLIKTVVVENKVTNKKAVEVPTKGRKPVGK